MPSVISLLNKINKAILNPFIVLLFSVALLVFLWGVFEYIRDAGNEKTKFGFKEKIMWGLIGMLIMVSVYGIIRLILTTFGVDTNVYPLNSL
jgi:hypothetical protein